MRAIGTIPDEALARRFTDYLLTRNIPTRLDVKPEGSVVWVQREEQVEEGRRELREFLNEPDAARYQGIVETARALRRKAEAAERQHVKNSIPLSGRWDYRPAERCPLTILLIAASIAVGVISHLGERKTPILPLFLASFRVVNAPDPRPDDDDEARALPRGPRVVLDGLDGLRRGQVWRLVTPIFIHFGPMHLIFNMIWLYDLGGLIEIRKGSLYLLGLVVASAVASNLAEYAYAGPVFAGGMSGVVYALFGFIWMRERYDPIAGMALRPSTARYMMIWLVLCMTGFLGPIANAAHVVGLAVGVLIGITPHTLRLIRRWH